MPKQKVDKAKFGEIKAYLSYHSVTDAVSKYKVCRNTIHQIKNHHSYDEWRAETNKKQREAFLARKAKVFKKGNGFNFTPPHPPSLLMALVGRLMATHLVTQLSLLQLFH